MGKLGMIAATRVLKKMEMEKTKKALLPFISYTCFSPGFCKTRMNPYAKDPPPKGALIGTWLATRKDNPKEKTGIFYFNPGEKEE